MKEEKLISLETARMAKEKGFDIPVIHYYTRINKYNRKNHISYSEGYMTERLEESNWNNGYGSYPTSAEEVDCSAPTQSLLQKWLREEHNISVNPIPNFKTKLNQYHLGIVFIDKGVVDSTIIRIDDAYKTIILFDSYEEALEKGLQEALKLIK